jgi:hypothetical protein
MSTQSRSRRVLHWVAFVVLLVGAIGTQTAINGAFHDCFVALDALTGDPRPWNINTGSAVAALALNGSHLYLGGLFGGIGSVTRPYAAAIDALTGSVLPWNPSFNYAVYALSIRSSINVGQSVIFVGGGFTQVNGVTRYSIAAISEAGGVTAWTPALSTIADPVYAIRFMPIGQFGGGTVWVGGNFGIGPGGFQRYAAALDASTGALKPWDPHPNGPVRCIQVYNGALLVGGDFGNIGGQPLVATAMLDMSTASASAWDAKINSSTYAVLATGNSVYLGGVFSQILSTAHRGFGALSGSSTPTAVEEEPTTVTPPRTVLHASPNPFEQEVTVRFTLPRAEQASVRVYDVSGRLVRTLRRGTLGPGEEVVRWDGADEGGKDVGSGIYFVRVDAPSWGRSAKTFRLR